ncbi:MAG: Lysophospholipase and related esterase [Chthonomonadaceae bacterium]|nr:Lysophospholipase and related esterase [Chthonomonadaceae bacterium]
MRSTRRAALLGMLALGLLFGVTPAAIQAQTPSAHTTNASKGFYLKDGDRVVFYGDSITDQRLYTTFIESYCVSRFPKKHFTFVHSGWGGDRVTGGGGGPIDLRLDRDVFVYKPNVVTICLGMNDGSYRAFDQGIFDTYVKGYRHILDRLTKELPGVRLTLLTASAYDDFTRPVGFPGGYNATLIAYGKAVQDLANEYKATLADTNAPLVDALTKAHTEDAALSTQVIRDRVHPGPGGHIVMAAAVLKAWHAPDTVTDVEIDGKSGKVVKSLGSKISGLKVTPESITFTHTDTSLPWPIDRDPTGNKDTALMLKVTDIEQTLDRYQIKIVNLPAAKYAVKVDGEDMGTLSSDQLNAGIDLAGIPTLGPNKQAAALLALIRRHNDLHFQKWRTLQVPNSSGGKTITPDVQAKMDDLDKQEVDVLKELPAAVQPKPHTVVLTPAN